MGKIFFIITTLLANIIFCQAQEKKCSVDVSYTSEIFTGKKYIEFSLQNKAEKNIKVPKKINSIFFSIIKIEMYNKITKSYDFFTSYDKDINCANLKCYGKMIILHPNEVKNYMFEFDKNFLNKKRGNIDLK